MPRSPWYDSDDPRRVAWGVGRWTVLIVVVCAVIGAAVWGIGVATSDTHGRGEAIKQKNSALNRVGKQELFEDLYADIKAYDRQISVAAGTLASAEPDSRAHWQSVLTGLRNQCVDAVGQYEAEARKYSARDFRAADLPPEIDELDPATDCEENR